MKKIIIIVTLLALSIGTFSCGGGSGSSSSPHGENPGLPSVVQLRSSHNVAQTNATVYLHARILDGNGVPVKNEPVTFTNLSELGVIKTALRILGLRKPVGALSVPVVKTDNLGIATVKLTSTTSGFATIQAEVNGGAGQVRDKRTIFFGEISGPVTTPPPAMSLHVDDHIGAPDQDDDFKLFKNSSAADNQRTIKAIILNGSGGPLANVDVTFGSDSPNEVTFDKTSPVKTNTDGEAIVHITVKPAILSSLQRVLNITAQATADSTSLAAIQSLFLEPVTVTQSGITVSANPTVVTTDGTSAILATVKMLGNLPVPDGSAVSFETITCGSVTPFAQTTDGLATATFTAPSIAPSGGICQVRAKIGSATSDPVAITVTTTATLTVQPSTQTMNGVAGGAATFTIFGGTAPYTVTSTNRFSACNDTNSDGDCSDADDSGIWNVSASSNQFFTVRVPATTPAGDVTLSVRDSAGTTATATLTIGGGTALSVLPSAVTVYKPSASDDNLDFTIFGGFPPYNVYSNNVLFPAVPITSTTFRVTVGANAPTGTVIATVRDNAGATSTATITISSIPSTPLKVIPTSQTISNPLVGDPVRGFARYTVTGGTGTGYVAYSSNPALVTTPMSGNVVTATVQPGVTSLTADTTVTISIFDSAANTVPATLVLDVPPAQALTVLPDTRSISGVGGGQRTFTIYGGAPGYTVTSSNPSKAYDSGAGDGNWSVALSGDSFTINVPPNTVAEDITLTVSDQAGATKTATLKITAGPTLSVQPGAQTISGITGGPLTFTVAGGTQGYIVTSSNPAIAYDSVPGDGIWNVASSGDTFVVNVPGSTLSGSVTLTVTDSGGSSPQSATLTIAAPTITLSLTPDTFDIGTAAGGTVDLQYFVSGGAAPYQVFFTLPMFVDAWSPTHNGWWVGSAGDNNQEFTVRYQWGLGTTAKFDVIVVDSLGNSETSAINMAP
jgi:hypothetical protein